jgi:hypothetical protein
MIDIDKEFVFIGGLHRSGTSLLHRCITDHPEVSGFSGTDSPKDEGQHLQDVYEPAASYGGPGTFGFDPDSYLDESSPLANRENAQELFSEWSEHWNLNKPVLVEKSPPNLVRGRFLQALFPGSRLIVIVRHPVAVSYATRKWTDVFIHLHERASTVITRKILGKIRANGPWLRFPIWLLIQHWVVCHEKLKKDENKIEKLLVLRYENLTERPSSTLEKVWSFLGLETFDPQREIRREVNQKYFDRWKNSMERQSRLVRAIYSKCVLSGLESRVRNFKYTLFGI